MNTAKRKSAILITCAAMMVGATACGKPAASQASSSESVSQTVSSESASQPGAEVSYPIQTGKELNVWSSTFTPHQTYTSWEQSPFHTYLEKATGIKVNWEFPAAGTDAKQAVNTMLVSGTLPDIIITNRTNEAQQDLDDGVIIPLDDLIEQYAPNYKSYLADHPGTDRAAKASGGEYFAFRSARGSAWANTYIGPIIRKDWLDEQNLSVPTNIDEWTNVLTTFKDKYGAQFISTLGRLALSNTAGAFDAFGGFYRNNYVDASGKVQLAQARPEWKDYLTQMNSWYKGGLIDPDMVTADDAGVRAKALNGKTGLVILNLGSVDTLNKEAADAGQEAEWIGISYPTNAKGEVPYIQGSQSLTSGLVMSITKDCPEDKYETAMRWMDYGFSEEGFRTWNFGEEGVSYTLVNGEPTFTDLIIKSATGIGDAMMQYTGNTGNYFGIQAEGAVRQKNSELACAAVDAWMSKSTWDKYELPEGFSLTTDENSSISNITTALETHISEQGLKFMVGDRALSDYDSYLDELKSMGLEQYLEVYQAAYSRVK